MNSISAGDLQNHYEKLKKLLKKLKFPRELTVKEL